MSIVSNKKKIHLIMPMAGGGTRFKNEGFDNPKPLIELYGHPFFYYATNSLSKYIDFKDITFAVLDEHIKLFKIDDVIEKYMENFSKAYETIVIEHVLNGAVLTCMNAVMNIEDDMPIIFNDCDHAFLCNTFYLFCNNESFNKIDGGLLTFNSNKPCYSYVKFNDTGNVCETKEKEVVSNEAICGAYYFRNKEIFIKYANKYLNNCSYKEFFMSGIYNKMSKDKLIVKTFRCEKHVPFGTPEEFYNVREEDLVDFII